MKNKRPFLSAVYFSLNWTRKKAFEDPGCTPENIKKLLEEPLRTKFGILSTKDIQVEVDAQKQHFSVSVNTPENTQKTTTEDIFNEISERLRKSPAQTICINFSSNASKPTPQ